MIIKKVGVFIEFLFIVIFLLLVVSARSCWIQSNACSGGDSNTVMKLATLTNTHGEEWNQSNYGYYLCCDFTGEHSCSGNNKVLKLSASTNAHAEIPTGTAYPVNVCFGDLKCESATTCESGKNPILSLSSQTNAHIGGPLDYATKICCDIEGKGEESPEDLDECELTSARWSSENVVEGTLVNLEVQGTNCDGKTLSFVVLEDDLVGDDPVTTNPANVIFDGNSATGIWTAEYQDDANGEPEYYFIATIASTGDYIKSSEPNLIVSQSAEIDCVDISLCTHYKTQQTCENDTCEVADYSVEVNNNHIT